MPQGITEVCIQRAEGENKKDLPRKFSGIRLQIVHTTSIYGAWRQFGHADLQAGIWKADAFMQLKGTQTSLGINTCEKEVGRNRIG
jgi:hypothetical protein